MNVLFDLNVILDILENREPFVRESVQSLARVVSLPKSRAYVATHAVTTAFYILRKHLGLSVARTALRKLLKVFSVLPATEGVLVAALDVNCPDYEDGVSFLAAEKAHCDCIVTRNVSDFAESPIPVFSPAGFLVETTPPHFATATAIRACGPVRKDVAGGAWK